MTIYHLRASSTRSLRHSSSAQAQFDFDGEDQTSNPLPNSDASFLGLLTAFNAGSIDIAQGTNASVLSDALHFTHNALASKAGERAGSVSAFIADTNLDVHITPTKACPDAVLRSSLHHLAKRTVAKVAHSIVTDDPILGPWSKSTSIGGRLQIQHGYYLPKALGLILKHHGLIVWLHPNISLSENILDLARSNNLETLQKIDITPNAKNRLEYKTDLIVHCRQTGWTAALDGKRGGGQSDSTAKKELIPKLIASALTLPYWAREKRLQPTVTDARVIDFIGSSSFPETISVKGWDLDDYFGCAVEEHIAYFTACCRVCAARLMAVDGFKATGANANPEDLIETVRAVRPGITVDLFAPANGRHLSIARYEDSRGAALARLNARAAA